MQITAVLLALVMRGVGATMAAEPVAEAVIPAPAMPSEQKMAKPAPPTGDSGIVVEPKQQASESQDEYVERMLAALTASSSEIKDLRQRIAKLSPEVKKAAMPSLRTASGNRVAALTKLQGLAAANARTWNEKKPSVEAAFRDLHQAIARTRTVLGH